MMKKMLLSCFILLVFAQWLIPGRMIFSRQEVLEKGKIFHFLTEPVDPAHPFKGRYVALNFQGTSIRIKPDSTLYQGQTLYAHLENDSAGFARIRRLHRSEPKSAGNDYLKITIDYIDIWNNTQYHTIRFSLPFEEFYMDEFSAPRAEQIYLENAANLRDSINPATSSRETDSIRSGTGRQTFAVVKVYQGKAVLQDLLINGVPVKDLIGN